MAIRMCCVFRTVSTEAVLVIAGIAPINLQVEERTMGIGADKCAKTEARQKTLNSWQNRWEAMREVVQWSKRLIANILLWIDRKHGSDHLAHLLTGHGCFQAYFCRFKLEKKTLNTAIPLLWGF
ncbi:uncharacterized protein LOC115890280 [Sitophilus oryzae]|uniref:Uncharacterized protein LOC115890280 n=1 Tax=Sitophilus oryzae TaxID=7048 RepID=A0A6J2YSS3_SITOR|nr:uncharacterized protein LOC115890280 [Sitophilus oryzae]